MNITDQTVSLTIDDISVLDKPMNEIVQPEEEEDETSPEPDNLVSVTATELLMVRSRVTRLSHP